MTNNTDIYWEANGLSLHTYAWSVETFGGRRYVPAPRKGSDVPLPLRRGRVHVDKLPDSQVQTLSMWLAPFNEDGTEDPALTPEQKMHANWRKILDAIDVPGQFPLVKRWYLDDGTVHAATAQAEYQDGLEPTANGRGGLSFATTLLLADPYYYEPVAAQPVGDITVLGDVPTDHVQINLSGGTNPRLTFPDGNWIQYNGSPGGTDVIVNCLTGNAKRGNQFVNGLISRANNFGSWPVLDKGAQSLTLTGGGTATITYDAAYR